MEVNEVKEGQKQTAESKSSVDVQTAFDESHQKQLGELKCKYCGANPDAYKIFVDGVYSGICSKCLVKVFDKVLLRKKREVKK